MLRHAKLSSKLFNMPTKMRMCGSTGRSDIDADHVARSSKVPPRHSHHLAATLLSGLLAPYWEANPSSIAAIEEIQAWKPVSTIAIDHIAFRTFGLPGMDIDTLVTGLFSPLGWKQTSDVLDFPKKKIWARWLSPPSQDLPRVFISQLKVSELSSESQAVLAKCANEHVADALKKVGPMTAFLGVPPWDDPELEDYRLLSQESEYAAWVLLHGFCVNHATLSVHRLDGLEGGIEAVNAHLKSAGFKLNCEGGEVKRSPDGLLLQSSTVADVIEYEFAQGEVETVPGSYIEFAERKILPDYAHLPWAEVEEHHRRDGFEVGSADKIFESTTVAARDLEAQHRKC